MSLCLNFNGFSLVTDTMIETPSRLQVVALPRTTEKQERLFGYCLASSFCTFLHTTSIEFSCESDPQTCLCPPKSGPTVSCPHLCTLALEQSRRHLQNVPNQSLRVSQPPQDLRASTTVDIIPESSSSFQDLIVLKRDFWYLARNLFIRIQLVILFE